MANIPADMFYARVIFDLYVSGQAVDSAVIGFHGHRNHTAGNTTDPAGDSQRAATGICTRFVSDLSGLQAFTGEACVARQVDVYALDIHNKAIAKGTEFFSDHGGWAGTSSAALPWQCAMVASLYGYPESGITQARGRKRGRFYFPVPGAGVLTTDGRLSSGAQEGYLENLGAFLNDVQGMHITDMGPGFTEDYWELVVLSVTGNMYTQVERIGVGRVMDTQRRRRKKLAENPLFTPLVHSD